MINIGNYRESFLKLFCMEFKLSKCFFLQKFHVRKLSVFDRLNTISGLASDGRGFCHGVVGVTKVLSMYIFRYPASHHLRGPTER